MINPRRPDGLFDFADILPAALSLAGVQGAKLAYFLKRPVGPLSLSRTAVSAPALGEAELRWRFKQRADHGRPAVATHAQDEECHLRHQDSPQSFPAAAPAHQQSVRRRGHAKFVCNFYIAMGDEKASAVLDSGEPRAAGRSPPEPNRSRCLFLSLGCSSAISTSASGFRWAA